ncbi:MAG: Asp-tRNA(Asn)/Glu-tRNA(Gln) amidotransferase subunit GatC [Flavobacteriales bacterium]|jgi:aspartyl-tRNA(Asn)/glutamyl-tRNA(Gln) amidotransferase subunit C|nr:Asp-tRNA(Asn)/Glu-tRNA(Gln) amidotransferase subunit GatC [Flavobacteriales bacterium]
MKVDHNTIAHLERLAKLKFSEEEKGKMLQDFEKIVGFVDQLNELDTTGIDPQVYVNEEFDHYRKDEAEILVSKEEALKNAAKKDSFYIRVPKVLK